MPRVGSVNISTRNAIVTLPCPWKRRWRGGKKRELHAEKQEQNASERSGSERLLFTS